MLIDVDKMPAYERQLLLVFKQAEERSPELTPGQKNNIEELLQKIVFVWTRDK